MDKIKIRKKIMAEIYVDIPELKDIYSDGCLLLNDSFKCPDSINEDGSGCYGCALGDENWDYLIDKHGSIGGAIDTLYTLKDV